MRNIHVSLLATCFFIMPPSKRTKCSLGQSNPPPPSPPQRDLRLRPRLVRLLVEWHLPVKKYLATGLETAKVRYIQSSCFARETLCCFLRPPTPPPPHPPYNGVEYDMKNYAARGESYQRPKAEVDDKGSPREVEDR